LRMSWSVVGSDAAAIGRIVGHSKSSLLDSAGQGCPC
jgi:hypothetical protein